MTTLYKLTDAQAQTRGRTQWGEGVEYTAAGEGDLCGPGWLHAYEHPLLAVLHDPVHGRFGANALLWECDGDIGKRDGWLKCGCTRLKTVRRIPRPELTTEQHIRYAILCAWPGCTIADWRTWAKTWWAGVDRSREAAGAARRVTCTAWSAPRGAYAWDNRQAEAAGLAAEAAGFNAVQNYQDAKFVSRQAAADVLVVLVKLDSGVCRLNFPYLAQCAVDNVWPYGED